MTNLTDVIVEQSQGDKGLGDNKGRNPLIREVNKMYKETCEGKIDRELASRLKEIRKASRSEKKREEFEEGILAISKTLVYRVELSYGGPQDYFEIEVTEDGKGNKEIINIEYHYLNWFDGAVRKLEDEEFELVSEFFSWLLE